MQKRLRDEEWRLLRGEEDQTCVERVRDSEPPSRWGELRTGRQGQAQEAQEDPRPEEARASGPEGSPELEAGKTDKKPPTPAAFRPEEIRKASGTRPNKMPKKAAGLRRGAGATGAEVDAPLRRGRRRLHGSRRGGVLGGLRQRQRSAHQRGWRGARGERWHRKMKKDCRKEIGRERVRERERERQRERGWGWE